MTSGRLKLSIAANLALVLFALSPLAPLLGMAVAWLFVTPVLVLFALGGGITGGHDPDFFVTASFLALGTLGASVALIHLYRAAGYSEKGDADSARAMVSVAIHIACVPLVMYLSFRSLGIG